METLAQLKGSCFIVVNKVILKNIGFSHSKKIGTTNYVKEALCSMYHEILVTLQGLFY